MGFLEKDAKTKTKKGMNSGWLVIIVLVTITGLATSTLTITFTKYIKCVEDTRPAWVMQDAPVTGTAIGSFYNNLKEETVWVSGPKEVVSYVKMALQTERANPLSQETFHRAAVEDPIVNAR